MTHHQENLVAFFRNTVTKHVGASYETGKKAQLWEVLDFLEEQLRKELKLYEPLSAGYHNLLDLLIETKTVSEESAVAKALIQEANDCYRFVK